MRRLQLHAINALIIIAVALLTPLPALAHKVGIYAYVENGQVKGQAYFAGGGKAVGSAVSISDGAGKAYGPAATGGEGEFSFALPPGVTPPLKLTLKASQGHQASYEIPANELPGAAGIPPAREPEAASAAPPPSTPPASAPGLSSAELERVVAKVIGEKLAPLNAQVAKLAGERSVTVHDIAAGIGYILGLLGLTAWLKSRRR